MHKNTTKLCKNTQTCSKNCVQNRKICTAGKTLAQTASPASPSFSISAWPDNLLVREHPSQPTSMPGNLLPENLLAKEHSGQGIPMVLFIIKILTKVLHLFLKLVSSMWSLIPDITFGKYHIQNNYLNMG